MSDLALEPLTPELVLVCPELRGRALASLPDRAADAWLPVDPLPTATERAVALVLVVRDFAVSAGAGLLIAGAISGALTLAGELAS